MSIYGTLESHHNPLSCLDCLVEVTRSSSSASKVSTMSTSSGSTSMKASSTIHVTILPSTTLSTAIRSATPSPSSKLLGNGLVTANPTRSSAGVTQSSFSLPIEPSSQSNREHVIILVLIAVIVFVLIFFVVFYLFRRSRQMCKHRQQDLEDGKDEVAAARAMWADDESLKEGYHTSRDFHLMSPAMPRPPLPVKVPVSGIAMETGVITHPLYQPGIKRSRTLPSIRPVQLPRTRPAMSYPNVINGQTSNLNPPMSPLSLRPRLKSEPQALTAISTMQTRRLETPEPLTIPTPFRREEDPELFLGRQIKSFWSSSPTASIAPSSPSAYSPRFQNNSQESLRPAPNVRGISRVNYSPYQSQLPASHQSPTGGCPLFALDREDCDDLSPVSVPIHPDVYANASSHERSKLATETARDDSPTLQPNAMRLLSACCPYTQQRYAEEAAAAAPPIPQVSPPSSPRLPPRSPTPPLPRSPLVTSPFLFEHIKNLEEVPMEQIEKWLDGSTGTVSAFGSILDGKSDRRSLLSEGAPPSQTMNQEASSTTTKDEVPEWVREQEREYAKVARTVPIRKSSSTPSRISISPIRSMRSSASRKGSRDDHLGLAI